MGVKMRAKISLRAIGAMGPNSIIWDTEIRGLNARRQFSEVVTYSIVYQTLDGVQRWQKIGRHGTRTPDLARKQARSVLMARDLGKDPSADRMALRSAPTVSELCDEYQKSANGKKLSTLKSDASRIATHIKPKLGMMKVTSVTSEVVENFMNAISPGSAKRVTGLLGAIFSFAVKRKMRETNPCTGVEKPKDGKRTRRLSNDEYAQLGSALDTENNVATAVFLLLAVTGFRSGEAKNLRWSECDLERNIVTLGDTKTGVSVRPLSNIAIDIIQRQSRTGEYVFAHQRNLPINNLRPWWLKLGMPKDVSPHTLRHSFASLAADLGHADSTIAGLIGHKQQSMTSRYLHLDKALVSAANIVAQETLRLMRS
jgi:integrase